MALAEACSLASQQRAGTIGLSAGVATDLRLGWDLGQPTDQIKAEKRLSDEKPHLLILSSMCLSHSRLQHTKPDELAEMRESRANVIWRVHVIWRDCKSSEVDAFSLSILGGVRRSRA